MELKKSRKVARGASGLTNARHIRLQGDCVLIKLDAPERILHGLILPDSAKRSASELWRGTVVAVGPGRRTKKGLRILPDVEPGDKVGFNWIAAKVDVTKWPSDEFRIVHETDVMWKQVA